MVELLKPKQPIDSRKQPIVCFGTKTEKCFCFDWALNVLTKVKVKVHLSCSESFEH